MDELSHKRGGRGIYKKNFGSPLHAALIKASRSEGVLATGLQYVKGLGEEGLRVRWRW